MIINSANIQLDNLSALPNVNVWCKDLDGVYFHINETATSSYCSAHEDGFSSEDDILGRNEFELFTESCATEFRKNDLEIISTGCNQFYHEVVESTQMEKSVQLSLKTLYRNENNTPIGTCGICIPLQKIQKSSLITSFITCAEFMNIEVNTGYLIQLAAQAEKVQRTASQWESNRDFLDYGKIKFTYREAQVLHYFLRQHSASQTAKILEISPKTVEWHLANMKHRLGVYNKSQLTNKAIDLGFIDLMFMEF